MPLLLLIPIGFGWMVSRRLLRESDPLAAGVLALSLAVAVSLLGVNGLYYYTSLESSIAWTLGVEAAVGLLLLLKAPPELSPRRLHPVTMALLAAAAFAVYVFTNAQQIANPDDDYWIHAPLQGLMLHGNFPPYNPFFSDIPMNGHYGRNLSIVTVARLTGGDTFGAQMAMTTLLQLLTLLLVFVAFHQATGSELQALLGTGLIFFGINVGGRGGLMDTLQNNNPYVHLYLALIVHLLLRTWSMRSAWAAVAGGLVLGNYAIVYETHFGLVMLTILGVTPVLACLDGPDRLGRRELLLTGLMLGVALPLAATQGGPLTNLVERKLHGEEQTAERLSKGMQNQSQVVKIRIGKERLFHILLEPGEYQRISYVYRTETFLKRFYSPSPGRGYRPIWSWDVLKIHFLPMYLMPWSALVLLRCRHRAGLLMGAFGLIAFLVPAVVDFGPVYESEYFRWQFAAGLGLAGALGLAVGHCAESVLRRTEGIEWTYDTAPWGLRLTLYRKGLVWIGLVFFVWLNTISCASFLEEKTRTIPRWGGLLRGALLFPATPAWLKSHAVLDFEPIDWEAARWLSERSGRGTRLLTNFSEENNFSILFESTLTGVSGARCVGHALPLDDEAIGTTPFHAGPPARAYWSTLDPFLLRGLQVDWIYYRPTRERPDLEAVPGLVPAHEVARGGQRRLIYRVEPEALPLEVGPMQEEEGALEIVSARFPAHMRAGTFHQGSLEIRNRGREPFRLPDGVLFYSTLLTDPKTGFVKETAEVERIYQRLDAPIAPGGTLKLPLYLANPLEDGSYEIDLYAAGRQATHRIAGVLAPLSVDFNRYLAELRLERMVVEGPLFPGAVVKVRAVVKGRPGQFDGPQRLLANVSAWEPLRERFYLLPGVNLVELQVGFESDGRTELELPAMIPYTPGTYRLDLYLSPEQGEVHRYPGPEVVVEP
ncbi:MAG: hypothetical protein HY319_06505 [Armatimonadetes bacterium]|nr:hypothetical protein [Armatimonadota bacterium]